jgi:predicted Zn-dependent protease
VRAILLILLVAGFGCCRPPSEPDCGFVQNEYSRRVSWPKHPVSFTIDASAKAYESGIRFAASEWNRQSGRTLFREVSPDVPADIIIFVLSPWDGLASEEARTTIYFSDDNINHALIKINPQYAFYNGPYGFGVSMDSLMIHELGHALGLAHHPGTVMNPLLAEGEYRITLSQHELDAMACEY